MRAFGWRGYDCSRFYCGGFLGGEPPRAIILSVYASKSSLPGDCHVAALLAMTVALRVFAWSVIRVRVSSFLLYGISRRCATAGECLG